jgi:hypothetical protein
MWIVHPDAFQYALIPISRYRVCCIRNVPIDLRSTIERYKNEAASGEEEVLPTHIQPTRRYSGRPFVHDFACIPVAVTGGLKQNWQEEQRSRQRHK